MVSGGGGRRKLSAVQQNQRSAIRPQATETTLESSDFDAMNELYAKPGHLFRRMQQIAVAIFMEECKQIDLTPVQYASLIAIQAHPGIDATRLSSTIAFDRSTLGNVLERLEAKSLIQRKARNDDRRVKLLYVTKLGTKTLSEVEPSVRAAQSRMLDGSNGK